MGVRTLAAATVIGLALNPLPARADGAAVWKAKCAVCHGETGTGDTPVGKGLKIPPLPGNGKVAGMKTADIVAAFKANKKHAGVTVADADLEGAAGYAKDLATKKSGGAQ